MTAPREPSAEERRLSEQARAERAAASASAYARENEKAFARYVAEEAARKEGEARAAQAPTERAVKRTGACPDAAKRLLLRMHICGLNTDRLTVEMLCQRIDTERVVYAATLNCPEIGALLFDDAK